KRFRLPRRPHPRRSCRADRVACARRQAGVACREGPHAACWRPCLCVARPRHGLRRVQHLPGGRRLTQHRLAAYRTQWQVAHQAVPGRARTQLVVADRYARNDAVRHACALQVGSGGRAAAWLAWTCVRGGDRVGAMAFGNQRAAVDPQPGTRGALAVLGGLARWDAEAHLVRESVAEPLSAALSRARRMVTSGSQVWLLSDGWCTDVSAAHTLVRLKRHADVRAAIVVDALEHALAPAGDYVFETDTGRRRVDLSATSARAELRNRLAQGSRALAKA